MNPLLGKPIKRKQDYLQTTTIREFDGGWNVIDNDLNLSSKYAKVFRNVHRGADGAVEVRHGTRLFSDISGMSGRIINMHYFSTRLVVVDSLGEIWTVDGTGTALKIFDDTIAANLPDNPSGWGATEFVSFAVFNGDLIICNGVDKPLIVDILFHVDYLHDLADQTNINTPIARFVATADRYLVMAGDFANESTIYISNVDTSGTWFGDSAPNDGVNIDLGSRVPYGEPRITGIGFFRDKLVVCFETAILVGTLGVYDADGNHTPTFEDAIEQHGTVSHRAIQSLGDDMLFCDIVGVPSISRALFTGQISPDRVSQLIDPAIQASFEGLSTASLEDRVWSVYNSIEGQYMLFVPSDDLYIDTTETKCFVYTTINALKVKAWAEFRNWNYDCGCRSAGGRIFFGHEKQVHVLGNDASDVVERDFVGDQETFSDNTVFTDRYGFTPVADEADSGLPIPFDWQLPWADFGERSRTKLSKYLQVESKGQGRFSVDMFVDNILQDRNSLGEEYSDGTFHTDSYGFESEDVVPYDPALTLEFVGGDAPGFGLSPFGSYFGGSRRSSDERLFAWAAKFKIAKLRVHGETSKGLKFVSIGIDYLIGSVRR